MSQDIGEYVRLMLSLSQNFVINLGTLGTMGWILWQSRAGELHDQRFAADHPRLSVLAGDLLGCLRTAATHLAGHRLARLTVEQQTFEADFRFSLSQVREASEQIALYRGQAVEQ